MKIQTSSGYSGITSSSLFSSKIPFAKSVRPNFIRARAASIESSIIFTNVMHKNEGQDRKP